MRPDPNKSPKLAVLCRVYGEAISPQKRTSSTSKHEIFELISIFLGHFCPLGFGSGYGSRYPIESGYGYGSTTLFVTGTFSLVSFFMVASKKFCGSVYSSGFFQVNPDLGFS
jgi:hypothetical protein